MRVGASPKAKTKKKMRLRSSKRTEVGVSARAKVES